MSAPPPPHPKLNARAFRRDWLRWALTCLGLVLGLNLLAASCGLLATTAST